MIEFSKDHGRAWMEMMSAYQIFGQNCLIGPMNQTR